MIVVDEKALDVVIRAVKNLPVQGGFEAADAWVGCVITLEKIKATAKKYEPKEVANDG